LRLPTASWLPSDGLEFAATDASIILLARCSSRHEELRVASALPVEPGCSYIFRITGIRSEGGHAILGVRVRSELVGDTIVEASRRFWGGAAGWDDPDILSADVKMALHKEGMGGVVEEEDADSDSIQVEFVATETLARLSIYLSPAIKGQEIHIQMAELVKVTTIPVAHPVLECECAWLEEEMHNHALEEAAAHRRMRASADRRQQLERIRGEFRRCPVFGDSVGRGRRREGGDESRG